MSNGVIKYTGGILEKANKDDLAWDLRAKKIHAVEDPMLGKMITPDEVKDHPNADRFDGSFNFPFRLRPGYRACIDTGVVINFPEKVGARIDPRSGLAYKYGIDTMAGTIDPGYRGTIRVILINHGKFPFTINEGDRIAQLRLVRDEDFEMELDEGNIESTGRGSAGFGSTGVK